MTNFKIQPFSWDEWRKNHSHKAPQMPKGKPVEVWEIVCNGGMSFLYFHQDGDKWALELQVGGIPVHLFKGENREELIIAAMQVYTFSLIRILG